ncbi:protein DGCR6-like [Pluvialis apricaria]
MERFGGAGGYEAAAAEQLSRQQERHYRLLSELQALVKALPSPCQQRLSYTTLSDLALALLDGTVFEIVQGLLEIQHLTEKNLYSQRLQLHSEHRGLKQELFHRHKEAQQCCRPHNLPLLRAAQQREMEAPAFCTPGWQDHELDGRVPELTFHRCPSSHLLLHPCFFTINT